MMRTSLPLLLASFLWILLGNSLAQGNADDYVVILQLEGNVEFARSGWTNTQALYLGARLAPADRIFPDNATITALCPTGAIEVFVPSALRDNQSLTCTTNGTAVVGDTETRQLRVQRGGIQRPSIPYLIAPRASLVLEADVDIIWNAVADALDYKLIVRQDNQIVWEVETVLGENPLIADSRVTLPFPMTLVEGSAYSIDICIIYMDLREACTSDPGWSTEQDIRFRYAPNEALRASLDAIAAELGEQSAETLFAQAVLLITPHAETGYYNAALDKLNELSAEHSASQLATAPRTILLHGEIYRRMGLLLNANQLYNQIMPSPESSEFVLAGTELSAQVALARGLSSIGGDSLAFYERAVSDYAAYLDTESYLATLEHVCGLIGDDCVELSICQDSQIPCNEWSHDES